MIDPFNFGDGGAFPEFLCPQYPRESTFHAAALASPSQQGASTQLVVVNSEAITLAKPSSEALKTIADKTRDAVEQKLQEKSNARQTLARDDPFDRRLAKGHREPKPLPSSTTIALVADPAPIIRSPTKKKPSHASDDLVNIGFVVDEFHNRKNLVIPLEMRVAAAAKRQEDATSLNVDHFRDMRVLTEAQRTVQADREKRQRAEKEIQEHLLEAQNVAALETARKQAEIAISEQQQRNANESRQQRKERERLEREYRLRVEEEKRMLQKVEKKAARLGISLEELRADPHLRQQLELSTDTQSVTDVTALVDSRLLHDGVQSEGKTTATADITKGMMATTGGIEKAMQEQLQHTTAGLSNTHSTPNFEVDDEVLDDDDEDIFAGVVSAKKRRI